MVVKKRPWQEVAQEAQQLRDASLAEAEAALSVEGPEMSVCGRGFVEMAGHTIDAEGTWVLSLTLEELFLVTSMGQVSARDVVNAFLRQALQAQRQTNCITELLPSRALARAQALNDHLTATGNPKGILHGIPISLKSHISVRDRHNPYGYVSGWERIAPEDALLVQILERAGAVVHARTTEPQGIMSLECESNLYGRTTNPYRGTLSCGGSSGGDAALLALRGSVIGVGSDVGGSNRVPAAACGIYGMKPTAFRVPTTNFGSTAPGAEFVPCSYGPMSVSLAGIERFMMAVLAAEPWTVEPALVPMPWRETTIDPTRERPLRLGIMWHDGVVMPHPPITRALKVFSENVAAIPYVEVVDFDPYKHAEAWEIVSSLYFPDGGEADAKAIAASGEPWLPLTEWLIKGNPFVRKLTRQELEHRIKEREEYKIGYARAWNKTGRWNELDGQWEDAVDAIICPVAPGVATRHGTATYWSYTAVWNLLDYPAIAFPAGAVDKRVDAPDTDRKDFMSGLDRDNWDLYDSTTFNKVPIGLQIVGRRFDDERIVGILKYLLENAGK